MFSTNISSTMKRRLFGLPIRHKSGNDFKPMACQELACGIDQNNAVGGRLSVLNLLKNRIAPCDAHSANPSGGGYHCETCKKQRPCTGSNFAHISHLRNHLCTQKCIPNTGCAAKFWESENNSRPKLNISCKICSGPQCVELIVSSARRSRTLLSLCGVQQLQKCADFRSCHVNDHELHFVAFDLARSPTLTTIDLSDNPFKDFGKLILAEVFLIFLTHPPLFSSSFSSTTTSLHSHPPPPSFFFVLSYLLFYLFLFLKAIRENCTLKRLRLHHDPSVRTQILDPLDKIHQAKVHSFNFRMALSLFLKQFGVDSFPTRLIWEYLFGFDFIEICKPKVLTPSCTLTLSLEGENKKAADTWGISSG